MPSLLKRKRKRPAASPPELASSPIPRNSAFPSHPSGPHARIRHRQSSEERPLSALRSSTTGKSETPAPAKSRPAPADLARLIVAQLDDDKAENILEISLAGKSPMADSMVVASGRSARHVAALADHVARRLKNEGLDGIRTEGLPNADWVLIDAGDVIVHIFRPEVREFYNLERMWQADAPAAAPPRPEA
jgi:ribosome-associated protein